MIGKSMIICMACCIAGTDAKGTPTIQVNMHGLHKAVFQA